MIRRETDPELINRIANHPAVRPYIAPGDHSLDFSSIFPSRQTGVVILSNGEDAAMMFEQTADRVWQVSTAFEPSCRGQKAREVGSEMREYMRPWSDIIFGKVPDALPHAKRFYEDLGGEPAPWFDTSEGRLQGLKVGDDWYVAQPGEELYLLRLN